MARVEAIEFDEQLVERLISFVIAHNFGGALAAYRVDFINEDDAGGGLPRLIEEVAHAAGTDANKHFDKLGGAHTEKWHACLAGNSPG